MRFIFFFLICVPSLVAAQNDYLLYPGYQRVVETFFNSYSAGNVEYPYEFSFAKKPDGWHVVISHYEEISDVKKDEIFWSLQSGKFQTVSFDSATSEENIRDRYLKGFFARLYNKCPYYGYPGWEKDVMNTYTNYDILPDTILYGVGRAYSSYASGLIHEYQDYKQKPDYFNPPDGKNALTKKQLKTFRKYIHQAIEIYELVEERNPEMEVLVGDIRVKANNEKVTAFLDLRILQNEKEAEKEIQKVNYDPFDLTMARNLLESCEPNGILFTNGDNDTYIPLYVQSIQGIRKDVTVVNLSLFQVPRYIDHLRYPILEAKALPFSLDHATIKQQDWQVTYVLDKGRGPISIDSLLRFIRSNDSYLDLGDRKYHYVPSGELTFGEGTAGMKWKCGKYLLLKEIMFYDLLIQNNWERPVHFSTTVHESAMFGLEDYLEFNGLVYTLSSSLKSYKDPYPGSVNMEQTEAFLLHRFEWPEKPVYKTYQKKYSTNYLFAFNRLADEQIRQGMNRKAVKTLNLCREQLPELFNTFNHQVFGFIRSYCEAGEYDSAVYLAKVSLLASGITKIHSRIANTSDPSKEDLLLRQLYGLASKHRLDELTEFMDSL